MNGRRLILVAPLATAAALLTAAERTPDSAPDTAIAVTMPVTSGRGHGCDAASAADDKPMFAVRPACSVGGA